MLAQLNKQNNKSKGMLLPDAIRYMICVLWLRGSSAGVIAKALPAFTFEGKPVQLDINQVTNYVRRSPYGDRKAMGVDQRRQFLGDLSVLRRRLAPEMKPAKFRVQQKIPTSGGQQPIPLSLYCDASCLDEILAQHYGIIGDQRAARKALRRAEQPGRDGRPLAIVRDPNPKVSVTYDLNAGLHTHMVNKGLYVDPEKCAYPIETAHLDRTQMVERFIQEHEISQMSPVSSPELGLYVDGGGGGKESLTLRQLDAVESIGRWKKAEIAYLLLSRWYIHDACEPSSMDYEHVREAIDEIGVADGSTLPSTFKKRWGREAA